MFDEVYDIVSHIPKGYVMTYGQIARKMGNPHLSRAVGYALHANKKPDDVPCHRVVNKEGRVAPGYAFGGEEIQKKLLLSEGVTFISKENVDLTRHLLS